MKTNLKNEDALLYAFFALVLAFTSFFFAKSVIDYFKDKEIGLIIFGSICALICAGSSIVFFKKSWFTIKGNGK